jgi:hypothetical protein
MTHFQTQHPKCECPGNSPGASPHPSLGPVYPPEAIIWSPREGVVRRWAGVVGLGLLIYLMATTSPTPGAASIAVPVLDRAVPAPAQLGPTAVAIEGDRWLINGEVTYLGRPAEGRLMNVRMVNSVFEDDRPKSAWPSALPQDFDPEANTDAFIARLPEYVGHGMLGFTLNLQGGSPKYEGAHNSAFNSDGSLRPAYLGRVKRVIEAADQQGAVIILGLFYQRQHHQSPTFNPRSLEGQAAIRAAVANVAQWIKDNGFTNVVLEISNEYSHSGYSNWNDGNWLRSEAGQVELMKLARSTHPGLLVSTSGHGDGTIPSGIAQTADFVLIHTNGTALSDYPSRIASARSYGKPVVINEDDKLGNSGAQAAQLAVQNGAGWGAMLWDQNQAAPFEFDGAADDPTIYSKIHELTGGGPKAPLAVKLSVVVTEPHDGQSFVLGQPVKLTASPTAPSGGTVSRVEFYANSQWIGERTASPWSVQWTPPAVGVYNLKARAYDNKGGSADSQPVDVSLTAPPTWPGTEWTTATPQDLGMDGAKLDQFVGSVGGHGVIIKDGYLVKSWGNPTAKGDFASAAKPVISTLLFFAIKEGKISGVNDTILKQGWDLSQDHQSMTYHHLANMTSGYARGEGPGAAWAYNDYATNLYARTLFDRVYGNSNADAVARHGSRLGALQFQDGAIFGSRGGYGVSTSPRDFARIGWLWLNQGNWNGKQLLPASYFDEFVRAQVPASLKVSTSSGSDYLGVGTFGGSSDQSDFDYFKEYYGYNWIHNLGSDGSVRLSGVPADTYYAQGHADKFVIVMPSQGLVAAVRLGNVNPTVSTNFKLLADSVGAEVALPPPPVEEPAQEVPQEPAKGPVGYWKLDEGSGTTASDSSGQGNHGALVDAAWVTGKLGKALDFPGNGSHVSVPNSSQLQLSSTLTIAAWVNPSQDDGTDKRIVNKWRSSTRSTYSLHYNPGTGVHLTITDCNNNFENSDNLGSLPVDQWSHVAATFQENTSTAIFYVNGVAAGSSILSIAPCAADTGELYLGGHPGHNLDRWFKGKLDEVRLYNYPLSPEEVAALAEPPANEATDLLQVTLSVDLQGRPARGDLSWVLPFKVILTPVLGGDPIHREVDSDQEGRLVLEDIPPGLHDIWVKGANTLSTEKLNVDLSSSLLDLLDLGTQLAGDYNGDNKVDLEDYSALLEVFSSFTADLPGNLKPLDLNDDGVVDIVDYAILIGNIFTEAVPPF